MDTKLAHKAIKAARLAISEERISNDDTACNHGRTAGELAAKAGMTLAELDFESGGMSGLATYAWNAAVDGWYDAQPKDVSAEEFDALLKSLDNRPNAQDTLSRMWAELQRRRGL